jgi:hypothetical protein
MGHKKHRDIPMLSHEELQTLAPDGGPRFNRLIFSSSPYLLQHAENPVDWYPWGEEAFAAAARDDKPIFLSIGYATCHWCHVMARESFEDEEIAALLNEAFVCIKVDREERPDLDNIYMSVCQAMTGHGGWPLTVLMTADRKPFFTGTYFPRESRPQMIGMRDLISQGEGALVRRTPGPDEKRGGSDEVPRSQSGNGARCRAGNFAIGLGL